MLRDISGTLLVSVLTAASFQFDFASLNFLPQTWTQIVDQRQVNKLTLVLPKNISIIFTYIVNGAVISFSYA